MELRNMMMMTKMMTEMTLDQEMRNRQAGRQAGRPELDGPWKKDPNEYVYGHDWNLLVPTMSMFEERMTLLEVRLSYFLEFNI